MDEQQLQQIAQQIGPQVINQAVQRVLSELQDEDLTAEELMPLIAALEETLSNPALYPQTLQAMYEAEIAEPGDFPEQFDPSFVVLMVIVLNKVAEVLQQRQTSLPANFAKGGLTEVARLLQAQGRRGDSMLAHINPAEAAVLRRMGGTGRINPMTGLPEFGFFKSVAKAVTSTVKSVTGAVKDVVKSLGPVAPIIAAVAAPWAIGALAPMLGGSSLLAGALYGAGTSALTGGNVVQGALMGGLSGGLGDIVGGAASNALKLGLSPENVTLLGNALVGGAAGAATGQGFGKGAVTGAAGTMLGNTIGKLAGQGAGTAWGQGLTQAGKTVGQMSAAGFPLKQALVGGALSGVISGGLAANRSPLERAGQVGTEIDTQIERVEKLLADPSVPESAKQAYGDYLNKLQLSKSTMTGYQDTLGNLPQTSTEYQRVSDLMTQPGAGTTTQGVYQDLGVAPPPSAGLGSTQLGFNAPTALAAGAIMAPLALESLAKMQTPQEIQQAIKSSNPEYFENLRLSSWDWNDIAQKAAAANMPLGTYVATNWNNLTEGSRYTSPGGTVTPPAPSNLNPAQQPAMARGGALSKVAYLARGAGTGRSDEIDARLSDGEYVMDAETVALLGDGSTRAGAKKLDEMRVKLRQHKGKNLARGKFSSTAKSPLAYLKGAA